ncbi:MAG: hypothetical protein VYD19_04765, partial [Myxococcota bacterium]|nr:hypothetical protein [Myxococcota bacterium]
MFDFRISNSLSSLLITSLILGCSGDLGGGDFGPGDGLAEEARFDAGTGGAAGAGGEAGIEPSLDRDNRTTPSLDHGANDFDAGEIPDAMEESSPGLSLVEELHALGYEAAGIDCGH